MNIVFREMPLRTILVLLFLMSQLALEQLIIGNTSTDLDCLPTSSLHTIFFFYFFSKFGLISLIIHERIQTIYDVITSHVPKKVHVSQTFEYYKHIEVKSSQKSSSLKICIGGPILNTYPLDYTVWNIDKFWYLREIEYREFHYHLIYVASIHHAMRTCH